MPSCTAIAAFISSACMACSALAAVPVDQLQVAGHGLLSQEKTIGDDHRAADDFILPGLLGASRVKAIQVVMFGNGAPAASKFCLTIHTNNAFLLHDTPGSIIKSKLGAQAWQYLGPGEVPGQSKYLVTFSFASGELSLTSNTRFWVSAFARNDDAHAWWFGKRSLPVALSFPCRTRWNANPWQPIPGDFDLAFRIFTY